MATSRIGYGQVEPNHLSAQVTGQIYAQGYTASSVTQLENGQFIKYAGRNKQLAFTGDGEFMLVYNEEKLYDEYRETRKDFAMIKDNYTPGVTNAVYDYGYGLKGQMVPRLFKTNIGDIFTTNCLEKAGAKGTTTTCTHEYAAGDKLVVNANGYLEYAASPAAGAMVWKVIVVNTMPDGQDAVQLMRIQ